MAARKTQDNTSGTDLAIRVADAALIEAVGTDSD